MFQFSTPQFTIAVDTGELPYIYDSYVKNARLVDEFDLTAEGRVLYVSVRPEGADWPTLVIAQGYTKCDVDLESGVLLVPETNILFLAADDRLLAYDVATPARLWEDTADCGFWRWQRHEDVVLMHAEIELAAWSIAGVKLWSTFADPPWSCTIRDDVLTLIDCRGRSQLDLHTGLAAARS